MSLGSLGNVIDGIVLEGTNDSDVTEETEDAPLSSLKRRSSMRVPRFPKPVASVIKAWNVINHTYWSPTAVRMSAIPATCLMRPVYLLSARTEWTAACPPYPTIRSGTDAPSPYAASAPSALVPGSSRTSVSANPSAGPAHGTH